MEKTQEQRIEELEKKVEHLEQLLKRNAPALDAAWRSVPLGQKSPVAYAGG